MTAATKMFFIMAEKRRKVMYRQCDQMGFDPFMSQEERKKDLELYEEKGGWFHVWTQVSGKDSESENILVKSYGVIETSEGKLLELPTRWFRFIDSDEELEA